MRKLILSVLFCCHCMSAFGGSLVSEIEKSIKDKRASVGVAVIYKDKEFAVSNEKKYPVMSVFKFHIAVVALKKMEADNISLDKKACIAKEQILKNTYSPMRDKYPEQDVCISYGEILEYTVARSDNNACDWLINFAGGIGKVDSFIKSLGIKDANFSETENGMHIDIMRCYNNWSAPLGVARLLKKIHTENILNKEHFDFLERVMIDCSTGNDKLKAGLPRGVKIGHKTGSSDRTAEGVKICDADAGVIYLPNGEKCYIAVLIKDSLESDCGNAKIIADIAKITYEFLKKRQTGGVAPVLE